MLILRKILLIIVFLFGVQSYGQDYDGFKGYGVYKKYDKSYINPTLRGKHSVSLGLIGAISSPFGNPQSNDSLNSNQNDFNPTVGVHLGYNYLIIKRRKRIFGGIEEYRNEVKSAVGIHINILTKGEFFVMANYFNPFFSLKGKFISVYFFNEYGIGLHQSRTELSELKESMKLNLSIEPLRIRLGKSHINIHLTMNYQWDNDLLGKDRIKMGFTAGLRYYIYKN